MRSDDGRKPDVGPWDVWCQRFGIDPNTPDERILDDYLHNRIPTLQARDVMPGELFAAYHGVAQPPAWRDEAQRELYASWEAYDQARAEMSPLRRRAQDKAETYELERWWTL